MSESKECTRFLPDYPFATLEDLNDWILNYLPGKEVSKKELEDFFELLCDDKKAFNSFEEHLYDCIKSVYKVPFAEYTVTLKEDDKKSTRFLISKVEIN